MEGPSSIPDVFHLAYGKDPSNYAEEMLNSKRAEWKVAMQEEIRAPQYNGTWRVAKRGAGSNLLQSQWVYKTKTCTDAELERYKARIGACGNEQVLVWTPTSPSQR